MSGADSTTGTYTLSVIVLGANGNSEADTDFNGSTLTPGRVDVGASATGNIEDNADEDWFKVDLEAGKVYQIDMEGADTDRGTLSDPTLRLFEASGVVYVATDRDGGVGKNARLTYAPATSARYFISASRGSAGGTYTLSVREQETSTAEAGTDFADDITTLGMVEVGGSATGDIDPSGDEDWFRVVLEAGKKYQIDLEGSALPDPFLSLYDGSGSSLRTDDDGGENVDSRMVYTATATGAYYLGAKSASGPVVTGTYTLSVRDLTPPPEDLPANATTTGTVEADGSVVRGDILAPVEETATWLIDDEGTEAEGPVFTFDTDWFAVELKADRTYRIDMKGARFTFTITTVEEAGSGRAVSTSVAWRAVAGPGERVRVLAVDDDPQALRYVRDALLKSGYTPVVTGDPEEALRLVEEEKPDLVLLDLMLPGTDGIELMKDILGAGDVPVIFLSAYGRDELIARAFDMGAVDYVVKPLSPTELAARIRAALRKRAASEPSEPYVLGDLTIDYAERRVTLAGRPLPLIAMEYRLLAELSANAGRLLTYEHLLERVWGERSSGDVRPMRTIVSKLRRKLGDDADNPTYIFTEPRVGYRMPKGETKGGTEES